MKAKVMKTRRRTSLMARTLRAERLEGRDLFSADLPPAISAEWFETTTATTNPASNPPQRVPVSPPQDGIVPGEWIVALKPSFIEAYPSYADASSQLASRGLQVIRGLGMEGVLHVRFVDASISFQAQEARLRSDASLRSFAPERIVESPSNPATQKSDGISPFNDGIEPELPINDYWKDYLWGLDAIDVSGAWETTRGSSNVVVAVIDTGVDWNHPDLAANIWRNPNEIEANGLDDDGNGFIDDVRGWDFVNWDNDPSDVDGHGTHVAGTIAAVADNEIGIAGVAPGVKILPINGIGIGGASISAINYVTQLRQQGVNIVAINASFGSQTETCELLSLTDYLEDPIREATRAGIVFVAAAGNCTFDNDAIPMFPANSTSEVDSIITVAATTGVGTDDFGAILETVSDFSNYGLKNVDVAAPGNRILSTIPMQRYALYYGTSMAAPHVAGVVALIASANPSLSGVEIRDVVLQTVDPIPSLVGKIATGGRVNAAAAVAKAKNTIARPRPLVRLEGQVLTIDGTTADDVVIVNGIVGNLSVVANGATFRLTDDVRRIHFAGKEGNDSFTNNTAIRSKAWGGSGNDRLIGGRSRDELLGEDGNDVIQGGDGNDRLFGGNGRDRLSGGRGKDTFSDPRGRTEFVDFTSSSGDRQWIPKAGASNGNFVQQSPQAISDLSARLLSDSQIEISWGPAGDRAYQVRIQRSIDGVTWSSEIVQRATTTANRIVVPRDSSRSVRIRAENSVGASAWQSTGVQLPIRSPANLRTSDVWARATDLVWDDLSDNETGFRIAISRDGGTNWDNVGEVNANVTKFRVSNLEPGTRYQFKVRAKNSAGFSEYSNTLTVTTREEEPPAFPPTSPANLRISDVWFRVIDLVWDDQSSNELDFRLEISRNGGGSWSDAGVVGADVNKFRVINLDPATRYMFRVRASNTYGFSGYANYVEATTQSEVPLDPANLRTSDVWARTIDLVWDDRSTNESDFRVEISRDGGGSWSDAGVVGADVNKFRVTNLDPATRYMFRVRASNTYGFSGYANYVEATTQSEVPLDPANLRTSDVWARTIDLVWDDRSTNESDFRVEISRNGGGSWSDAGVVGADVNKFRVTNLDPATRYMFRVRASNTYGFSGYANYVEATTQSDVLLAPANLRTSDVWARTIDLVWDDRSSNESVFRIAISRDGGNNWDNIGEVNADITKFRVASLEPATRYWFKVRASNSGGFSDYSNVLDVTTKAELPPPPASPANLRTSDVWARTIDLVWDDRSSNESVFRIAISRDGGNNWDNIGEVNADITKFRVASLEPATRYWFKVRASNSGGFSDYSNVLDVTTKAELPPPPASPANLRTSDVWAQTIDLVWDDRSSNESTFFIAISRNGGSTWDNVGEVAANVTKFRVANLARNTSYMFKVRAWNSGGFSEYSNTLSVTTKRF